MDREILEDILSSIGPHEASRILGKYPFLKDRFVPCEGWDGKEVPEC